MSGSWVAGRLLAVLDVGKSNAKLVLVDPLDGMEIAVHRRPNRPVVGGPVRQLDVGGLERWMFETLAGLPERARVGAIVPVAHGAACVMLDGQEEVLLAPDYEDPVFEEESAAYDALRDGFEETFSPLLPLGLNLGRQIHWVERRLPELFSRVAAIMPYPQYWSFVLSGVAASEVTSLGCHTDLWAPGTGGFSPLVERRGWARRFAPRRRADERLGVVRPAVAQRCGLPADCVVLCGMHDSNASYLRHRAGRANNERFAVVSSGTWTILLAAGVALERLRAECDMLANVDVFGQAVGTARFMGGREYEAVAGVGAPAPTVAGLRAVLAAGATVLPGFAVGGQFAGRPGSVVGADGLEAEGRTSLASLYLALLTDGALDLLGASGPVVVDGPLAQNAVYPGVLASLRGGAPVLLGDGAAGSVGGARCLLLGRPVDAALREAAALELDGVLTARRGWRSAVQLCMPRRRVP